MTDSIKIEGFMTAYYFSFELAGTEMTHIFSCQSKFTLETDSGPWALCSIFSPSPDSRIRSPTIPESRIHE